MKKTYPLLAVQRRSRLLLSLICFLFIVTAPFGVILLILSQKKFVITESQIEIKPMGRVIQIKEIDQWGLGAIQNLLPSKSALNPSASPQRVSVRVGLIKLKSGGQFRIPLANYEYGLEDALKKAIKKKPQPLIQKGLFGLSLK